MDKKKITIAAIVVIVVIAIIVAISMSGSDKNPQSGKKPAANKTEVTETTDNEGVEKDEDPVINNNGHALKDDKKFVNKIKDAVKPGKNEANNGFFPYEINKYELEIKDIKSYDGIFFEDGNEQEVKNVATIIVKNNSDVNIEYGKVVLHGAKTDLEFKITALPKGATMVVQEINMKKYVDQDYKNITYDIAPLDEFEMSEDKIHIKEVDNELEITNLTDEVIPVTRVFFKLYMDDIDVYAGGITYTIALKSIPPKTTVYASPYHYAPGNSKIMMVRTYDKE